MTRSVFSHSVQTLETSSRFTARRSTYLYRARLFSERIATRTCVRARLLGSERDAVVTHDRAARRALIASRRRLPAAAATTAADADAAATAAPPQIDRR